MKIKQLKENWISHFAVTIAALALIASVWQSFLFRKHNELSVRPLIDIEYHTEFKSLTNVISLNFKNDGLGPAIVKAHNFILNGTSLTEDEVEDLAGSLCSFRNIEGRLLTKDTVIRASEKINFLIFDEDIFYCDMPRFLEAYDRLLSLVIKLEYESLYEDRFLYEKTFRLIFPRLAQEVDAYGDK